MTTMKRLEAQPPFASCLARTLSIPTAAHEGSVQKPKGVLVSPLTQNEVRARALAEALYEVAAAESESGLAFRGWDFSQRRKLHSASPVNALEGLGPTAVVAGRSRLTGSKR